MSNFQNTAKTFAEMWAYGRTGPSIYVPDGDGLLIEYPAAVAPTTHRGVLLEHETRNILLHSRTFTDAVWTTGGGGTRVSNQIGADGVANSATILTDTSGTVAYYIQQEVVFSPLNFNNDYPHVFSVYVKKTVGASHCAGIYFAFPLDDLYSAWAINTNEGAGTATRISSFGSDGSVIVEDSGDWWRVAITIIYPMQPDQLTARVRLYPSISATSDPGTIVVASQQSSVFDFAQLEDQQLYASSAIVTTTAEQVRGTATLYNVQMDEYVGSEVTAYLEYDDALTDFAGPSVPTIGDLLIIGPTSGANITLSVENSVASGQRIKINASDSSNTPHSVRYFTYQQSGKMAASKSVERDESNMAANGVATTHDSNNSDDLNSDLVLSARSSVYIKKVEIYAVALSSSELAGLTAA